MFKKLFTRVLMMHYRRKEKKEGKRYHRHFKADDGRVFELYSNERIGKEKCEQVFEYVMKNTDTIDKGNMDDIHLIMLEMMGTFFDFGTMISFKVNDKRNHYEIMIIRNGEIDLRI